MKRQSWKRVERKVAKELGGVRNPLSGSPSLHTAGDVIHPDLFVEVKSRSKLPFWETWLNVKERGRVEGKIPILVMHKKGSHDYVVMISLKDFKKLLKV